MKPEVIDQIVAAIGSFALYGFPESHAISFAILAYGSAYLKTHRAPEFYASLLNNQPMGFYSPATLIKDGRRHGVRFRPVCVQLSRADCIIEPDDSVRLGFCVVQGLRRDRVQDLLEARARTPFASLVDFKNRVPLNAAELRTLAEIGAFNALAPHRRAALWEAEKPVRTGEFENWQAFASAESLAPMLAEERLQADYRGMRLSMGKHPMAFLRPQLQQLCRASDLPRARHGQWIRIGGNVICRQRPGTAKGFVFISLEDETGISNAIVRPALFEKLRLTITQEPFLIIEGRLQNSEKVISIQAHKIYPLRAPGLVATASYDFR